MVDAELLRQNLEPRQADERVQRIWRSINEQPSTARRGMWRLVAAAGVCGAVAAAVVLLWPLSPAGPLTLDGGEAVPDRFGTGESVVSRFSDGTVVHTESGAELELLENTKSTMALALREGRVRFDIRPGGARVWRILCGAVTVEVLGTSFSLDRRGAHLKVSVERGAVLVRGGTVDDGVQKLPAGQSLVVRLTTETEPRKTSVERADGAGEGTVEDVEAQAGPASRAATKTPRWQQYAEHGSYGEAYDALGSHGVTRLTRRTKSVKELFILADVARLSGHPEDAVLPLKTIVEAHPHDSRSGLAAYTLGKIYLEQMSRPKAAALEFDRAVLLGLPEALAENAGAKLVRALLLAGDPRARQAGEAYLENHPVGRYRLQVETWLKQ